MDMNDIICKNCKIYIYVYKMFEKVKQNFNFQI